MSLILSAPALTPERALNWHRRGAPAVLGFGYAGGNASVLAPLAAHLPGGVGLAELVMPGRARRVRETPRTSVRQVTGEAVDQLQAWPGAPILFGYSLGALLAYETACRLQAQGRPACALVVAGLDAPHRLPPSRGVHRYDLPRLRTHLAAMGATPPELLGDLNILRHFAAPILADYELIETYRHTPRAALTCPIVAVAGRADDHTSEAGVQAWQELSESPCQSLWADAGHFFLQSHGATWGHAFALAAACSGFSTTPL